MSKVDARKRGRHACGPGHERCQAGYDSHFEERQLFVDTRPTPSSSTTPSRARWIRSSAGDQLRARGVRSADGTELAADEVVSGAFRNIAGTVVSIDAGNNTVTVMDLATKKPVTLRITADSQLRKLPPTVAQRIAVRLRGGSPDERQRCAGCWRRSIRTGQGRRD